MGEQSSPAIISELLRYAEDAGVESAWVVDHIAIPPDDAEGSGGRYLDPLTTLAFMAGQTKRIKLGTSVLILPYRQPLPTAKAIATIQELSQGRLLLGVGIGWMSAEFKALGVPRGRRGRDSDATLKFLHECFANDVVSSNGQSFIFKPRPARPPIYIGGSAPQAVARALRYGDGWLPMGKLSRNAQDIARYREQARETGIPVPEIVTFAHLDEVDERGARNTIAEYEAAGVTRIIAGRPYEKPEDMIPLIDMIRRIDAG